MSSFGYLDLADVLRELIELLKRPDTEVFHSRYKTPAEAVHDIEAHLDRIQRRDFSRIRDLSLLFGPTASLQEVSIDSGWGERFLTLAETVDKCVATLEARAR